MAYELDQMVAKAKRNESLILVLMPNPLFHCCSWRLHLHGVVVNFDIDGSIHHGNIWIHETAENIAVTDVVNSV